MYETCAHNRLVRLKTGNQAGSFMTKPLALIVEDDRDIAALFRHVLDIAGYHTEIVLHGKEAVKRLEATRPDIILLDLALPGVSGETILEKIRSDYRLKGVPVVVVTAFYEIAKTLAVEPDLVLLKPVNLEQLSVLVQRLRATSAGMQDQPWDSATNLYNRSFFTLRLTYSLERLRQASSSHFGVLFADLDPFTSLLQRLDEKQVNAFLLETARRLKTVLRPTDTTAHIGEGLFLILLEDVTNPDVPVKIAARLQLELGNYLMQSEIGAGLRAHVGVLLCEAGYNDSEEILSDVELARQMARHKKDYVLYDRESLMDYRDTSRSS
jgi:diguanylate cyclase (GGDEF)-like protein